MGIDLAEGPSWRLLVSLISRTAKRNLSENLKLYYRTTILRTCKKTETECLAEPTSLRRQSPGRWAICPEPKLRPFEALHRQRHYPDPGQSTETNAQRIGRDAYFPLVYNVYEVDSS